MGIPKTLVIWVRGYPKLGDTQITVTPGLSSLAPGGGKMRDPGNEVARCVAIASIIFILAQRETIRFPTDILMFFASI